MVSGDKLLGRPWNPKQIPELHGSGFAAPAIEQSTHRLYYITGLPFIPPRGFRIPNYTTNVSEGKEQTKQEALERDPKIAGGGPAEYSPHVHPHPGRVICHGRHSSGR